MFSLNKKRSLSNIAILFALCFGSLLQTPNAFANGGGGEEKKEGGEAKASDEAVDKNFSQGQLKFQNLSVRQEDYRKQIDELTEKRRKAKSKAEQKVLRDQMVEIEKTRKKEMKEIEELKVQLQYRYPDFGEKKKREYASPERKLASEPETDSLQDVLMSTKRAMEDQYGEKPARPESEVQKEHAPKTSKGGGHGH